MRRPKLNKDAAAFWDRHAPRCLDDGSLCEATVDAFVLLCRTWAMLATLDPDTDPRTGVIKFVALVKTFERQAVQFGITSKRRTEKPRDLAAIIREGLIDDMSAEQG